MPLSQKQKTEIDFWVDKALSELFDAIYTVEYTDEDLKPSEVAAYLNKWYDLGDAYREWWESDPEGEWS